MCVLMLFVFFLFSFSQIYIYIFHTAFPVSQLHSSHTQEGVWYLQPRNSLKHNDIFTILLCFYTCARFDLILIFACREIASLFASLRRWDEKEKTDFFHSRRLFLETICSVCLANCTINYNYLITKQYTNNTQQLSLFFFLSITNTKLIRLIQIRRQNFIYFFTIFADNSFLYNLLSFFNYLSKSVRNIVY